MSREPQNYGEIAHQGIVAGRVAGSWLLSYGEPAVNVAVFPSREDALDMAARYDELTKCDHFWRLDTVFAAPNDIGELATWLGRPGDGDTFCVDVTDDGARLAEITAIVERHGGSVEDSTGVFTGPVGARKAVAERTKAGFETDAYGIGVDGPVDLDAGQIALQDALHDDPDETSRGQHGGQCNLLYELAHDVRRAAVLVGIARTESDTICRVRIDPDAMCLTDGEITLLVTDNGGAVDYRGPDFLVAVFPSQACAETVITVLRCQGMTATLCDETFDGNTDYAAGWRRGVAALLYDIAHDDRRANALLQYAEAVEAKS